MKIVRFTGKFVDLIPDGWTFQKLFARNYRQYHKTCDGEKYSQGCRIWQHHGGYLEIDDLSSDQSAAFVQQILDGKIDEWGSTVKSIFHQGKEQTVYWFVIDQKENRFISRTDDRSDEYRSLKYRRLELDPDIDQVGFHEFLDRYREWNANPDLIEMLKGLVSKKWIAVEEIAD